MQGLLLDPPVESAHPGPLGDELVIGTALQQVLVDARGGVGAHPQTVLLGDGVDDRPVGLVDERPHLHTPGQSVAAVEPGHEELLLVQSVELGAQGGDLAGHQPGDHALDVDTDLDLHAEVELASAEEAEVVVVEPEGEGVGNMERLLHPHLGERPEAGLGQGCSGDLDAHEGAAVPVGRLSHGAPPPRLPTVHSPAGGW